MKPIHNHSRASQIWAERLARLEREFPFDGELSEGEDALDQQVVPYDAAADAECALSLQRAEDLWDEQWEDEEYTRLVVNAPVGKLHEGVKAFNAHFFSWDD